jgi:hypothetical protein
MVVFKIDLNLKIICLTFKKKMVDESNEVTTMLKWVILYLNLILKKAETEILFKTKEFIKQNQKIKKCLYNVKLREILNVMAPIFNRVVIQLKLLSRRS